MASAKPRAIGAGTVIAICAALALVAWNVHSRNVRQAAIEHQKFNNFAGIFELPGGPGIDNILKNSSDLALTDEQKKKLRAIEDKWKAESAPVGQRLREASKEMEKNLNRAAGSKQSLEGLQNMAAPVSEATAEYRKISGAYRKKALDVLTGGQRAKAEALFRERNVVK